MPLTKAELEGTIFTGDQSKEIEWLFGQIDQELLKSFRPPSGKIKVDLTLLGHLPDPRIRQAIEKAYSDFSFTWAEGDTAPFIELT